MIRTGVSNKLIGRTCEHVLNSLPASYNLISASNFRDHYITNIGPAAVTCTFDFQPSRDGEHSALFFTGSGEATARQPRKRHRGGRGQQAEDLAAAVLEETIDP